MTMIKTESNHSLFIIIYFFIPSLDRLQDSQNEDLVGFFFSSSFSRASSQRRHVAGSVYILCADLRYALPVLFVCSLPLFPLC